MYYTPTLIIISLLKMAYSFFLSLLVVFLAALMFVPQHFADAAFGFRPIKPPQGFPKINKPKFDPCAKELGKFRNRYCPPPTRS